MIRHSHPSSSYPASHYDGQLCLKPPVLLWVAVFYLSRAITLPIAMAIGHFAGVDSSAIAVFRGVWNVDGLIPSLMAAVMLYTLCRRVPTASAMVRWIWAHGRILLACCAGLDIILLLIAPLRARELNEQMLPSMLAALVDLYFLAYILAARRVRDAFAEFPPAPPPSDTAISARR